MAKMNMVLVHGILGFNQLGPVEYFNGIAARYSPQFNVLAPQLDPTRGVEFRGNQLRDAINAAFAAWNPNPGAPGTLDPNQKTHIIAHSMGGLDSRFILSPANPNGLKPAARSLTTISTPHRGSPIADLIDSPETLFSGLLFDPAKGLLQEALKHLGISLDGLRDLTTKKCEERNQKYPDNRNNVAYFSVAGSGRGAFPETAAALQVFYQYIKAKTNQPNDGLVTTASAQWGTFDPQTWPGDHAEEIGHNLDNLLVPPAFYLAKYDQIVAKISAL